MILSLSAIIPSLNAAYEGVLIDFNELGHQSNLVQDDRLKYSIPMNGLLN